MTHLVRRPTVALLAAILAASLAVPGVARASTVVSAVFMGGGTGTAVVGGMLYARSGAAVTLFVFTDAARCVDVTGAVTARRTAATVTTAWAFPFTAGDGDGRRDVTMTAWSDAAGTECAGSAGEARSVSFTLDNEGPAVTAVGTPAAGAAGWNQGDVAIAWSASDAGSGIATGPTPAAAGQLDETAGTEHTASASDRVGNVGTGSVTVRLDRTAPAIVATQDPVPNGAGWNRSDVTVSFSCADGLSGVLDCPGPATITGDTAGETVGGRAVDVAGNASSPVDVTVRIDRAGPTVALVGGPADGATYQGSSLPAAPGCEASDDLSGVDGSCSVDGFASSPGTHTVTASARDRAGNTSTVTVRYTVTAWTIEGFDQPVAMDGTVNVVNGGSTVPLKFEVFDGAAELTSPDVVAALEVDEVRCSSLDTRPESIGTVATGDTDVRYDPDGGQFVLAWRTPGTPGSCYAATVRTADGATLTALFRTR